MPRSTRSRRVPDPVAPPPPAPPPALAPTVDRLRALAARAAAQADAWGTTAATLDAGLHDLLWAAADARALRGTTAHAARMQAIGATRDVAAAMGAAAGRYRALAAALTTAPRATPVALDAALDAALADELVADTTAPTAPAPAPAAAPGGAP